MEKKGVIHISCEDLKKNGQMASFISAISFVFEKQGTTKTEHYSIHKLAQRDRFTERDLSCKEVEDYSREIARELRKIINQHKKFTFISWQHDVPNYGFQLIEAWLSNTNERDACLPPIFKINLKEKIIEKYGPEFEVRDVSGSQLTNLLKRNGLWMNGMIEGIWEGTREFELQNFKEIAASNQLKAEAIYKLNHLFENGKLKTKAQPIRAIKIIWNRVQPIILPMALRKIAAMLFSFLIFLVKSSIK